MKPSSLTAEFSAARQDRLPANARIHLDARDFQIIDFLTTEDPPRLHRLAVIYDADRDQRVLDFLTCASYGAPAIRANIIGVAESKGRIAVYYGDLLTLDKAERALSEAAHRALYPTDRWAVDLTLVPVHKGQLDRSRLPETSPLLAAPARFSYGLIEVKS
jgi:hypothetical protein